MPGLFRRPPRPQQRFRRVLPPEASLYQRTIIADTPRGYWRLGELTGNAQDAIGSNHGVYWNTPTLGAAGALIGDPNTSVTFLAASSQKVVIADNAALDVGNVLTLECWVKRTATGANHQLISKGNNAYRLMFQTDDRVYFVRPGVTNLAHSSITITDANWHHIVATKNGTTRLLYIDGVDVTTLDTDSTLTDTTDELRLAGDTSEFLTGSLDEVALYNYALTADQVRRHYRAGASVYFNTIVADRPAAYWPLDELTGTVADDVMVALDGTYRDVGGGAGPFSAGGGAILVNENQPSRIWSDAGDEVQLLNHAVLNPTEAISIELWVYVTDWDGNRRLFQKGLTDNQYRFFRDWGTEDLSWDINGIGSITFLRPTTSVVHHMVVTYDRAFLRAYLDGVAVGTPVAATGPIPTTTDNAAIGNKPDSNSAADTFSGYIDEVALYHYALSPAQVLAHYEAAGYSVAGGGDAFPYIGGGYYGQAA